MIAPPPVVHGSLRERSGAPRRDRRRNIRSLRRGSGWRTAAPRLKEVRGWGLRFPALPPTEGAAARRARTAALPHPTAAAARDRRRPQAPRPRADASIARRGISP